MSAEVPPRAGSLELDGLQVVFESERGLLRAVDGLSLSMQRGETFALVGESGCGKSLTAMALMRLLPQSALVRRGRAVLDGEELLRLPESAMRAVRGARIGMIFQEPSTSLNPVMRVGEQIIEAIETHTALRGGRARDRALEWLARVGIAEPERRIDDYPFRLSGGQKQRVMIAMVLACEPEFLIADEPTTALDVTIQAQILDLLQRLQSDFGMGMLLITHDLAVVSKMAHRIALMYAGEIVEVASAREFFSAPKHPYARLLLRALPNGAKRSDALEAIAGTVPPLSERFDGCRFAARCDRVFSACRQTPPVLKALGSRSVRCLLYEDGGRVPAANSSPSVKLSSPPRSAQPLGSSAAGRPILEVQALSVRFPVRQGILQRAVGAFTAVRDVSFSIAAGQTLALIGESGSGKTTTAKALVQLLRGQAQIDGKALFQGQDLFRLEGEGLRAARRDVQIIFQDPFASLDPRMRVLEILEEGLQALRPEMGPTARRARLEQLLDRVGLRRDALERYPHEFSGGQRQRLAIARALAVAPKLVICDEPTSALDVSVQAQILNLLRELQRELSVSYLFITHNIGVVEYVADHVAVMNQGRIEESGPAEWVLAKPTTPYTQALLAAVPRIEIAAEDTG